jgi:hypothetical protein
MIRKLLAYCILIVVLFCSNATQAQRSYILTRQWHIAPYLGTSNFHGDVSENTNSFVNNTPFNKYFYQDRKFGAGLYIDKMFTPVYGIRGNLLYSSMKGTNEKEKVFFTGTFFEYSLSGIVNYTNLFMGTDRFRKWDGYVFVGIGFSESRAKSYDLISGQQIGSNGYRVVKTGNGFRRMTEITFPFGVGFTYLLNDEIDLFVELTRHLVLTNKLDAYPVEDTKIESLGMINVGISYEFNLPKHWAPKPRNPRYNGKSPDPSIKSFNKNKHVVMKTKAYKKSKKMRKKYGRKKRGKHRW